MRPAVTREHTACRRSFSVTGATCWTLVDGTRHPTGFWDENVIAPYATSTAAGHQITTME
ncbi:hypothetical protein ACZ90_70520 [Streptomyces albus subsp. albus]|nr:hypothetical protein ACZ90_70520 [Streptomyces albus subsp. albus]